MVDIEKIRNFCIVAHIDHGKSTLADRILELTGTVSSRELREQFLDSNALERERGITIKAKAVAMDWKGYRLNLIDTPGHVDFSYEVSRSLAACEGAILLVDATQGVQAQTVANALLALEGGLEILPAVNKIDMQTAQVEETLLEMENTLGIKPHEVFKVSGKLGTGVEELLEAVLTLVPPPKGDPAAPLRALIFDSQFNEYRGVVAYVRLIDGTLRRGDRIKFLGTGKEYEVEYVGLFKPHMVEVPMLSAGQVGYLMANIKTLQDVRVGDTIVSSARPDVPPLPGYKEPLPVVFCGFYPTGGTDYEDLKRALERLSLNDSSFKWQAETSEALGFGFRCGFLGLLHMEIVQERLEREMGVELIQTAPNVTYEIVAQTHEGPKVLRVDNPAKLPDEGLIREWREPMVRARLVIPAESIGAIMQLCQDRRGTYERTEYISRNRVILTYKMPFAEIVYDFYDKLKSLTRGYGTLDYTFLGYEPANLCRLRILVAGQEVDALSVIVHRDTAEQKGRKILKILRKEIPRHLFEIALQAAIGGKIIAREDIGAVGKNVLAKCYGGDITRKRKLLEKQKEGKRRMKSVGNVEIPQTAFMAVLRSAEDES
ncbi:MAG TPA: translation elongation factor 4 [Planctomycetota bacterium]|nr:translation elongation factor 4 [Planctomycetota bacterium]